VRQRNESGFEPVGFKPGHPVVERSGDGSDSSRAFQSASGPRAKWVGEASWRPPDIIVGSPVGASTAATGTTAAAARGR
jgi:hypothetical protein